MLREVWLSVGRAVSVGSMLMCGVPGAGGELAPRDNCEVECSVM